MKSAPNLTQKSAQSGEQQIIDIVTAPNTVDWYIYYQVRAEHETTLHERVSTMQRRLLQTCGVIGSLKRRPQLRDGLHTWMEVYIAAPIDFDTLLAAEVSAAKLSELIDGERHVEHFWDVTSCA
jgi:hypothetical protein